MHAARLARLLRRSLALAIPATAAGALGPSLPACCSPYHVQEVWPVTRLPAGWTLEGSVLRGDGKQYAGSADDPGISSSACTVLCSSSAGAIDDCHVVRSCLGGDAGADAASSCAQGNPDGTPTPDGLLVICDASYGAICGRRPPGFTPPAPGVAERLDAASPGAHFAATAYLEAAAVDAFAVLRRELAAHHAPASLRRAAARAELDEVRHTRAMKELARRFGHPSRTRAAGVPAPARPLVEIAEENVREGCVRETLAAAVALHQAEHAADERVKRAFAAVAADEIRHAALSWRVHAWAYARLSRAERARVDAAAREARCTLAREARREPADAVARIAGLPRAATAQKILAAVQAQLPRIG